MSEPACCPTCHQLLPLPHGIALEDARVTYRGNTVVLTTGEIRIFALLFRRAGQMVSREALWEALYAHDVDGGPISKTLDVMIFKIRARLRVIGLTITTVWGAGFRLDLPTSDVVPNVHTIPQTSTPIYHAGGRRAK